MNENLWHQVNAVLGSLAVTVGLWLLLGAIPLPLGIAMGIGSGNPSGVEMPIHWIYLDYLHLITRC